MGGIDPTVIVATPPSLPGEVISHAVWLYLRFPLSLRMVEEMLAARGILVSHDTVRQWARSSVRASPIRSGRRLPALGTNGTSTVCHEHISEGGDVELY